MAGQKFDGDCSDAPNIQSYYQLWGKHEFGIEEQRNLLLWFIAEKNLDADFVTFLNHWFPEDQDGVRTPRAEIEARIEMMKKKLEAK
jgi:hypothetical protein